MDIKRSINNLLNSYITYINEKDSKLIAQLNKTVYNFQSFKSDKEIPLGNVYRPVKGKAYNTIEEKLLLTKDGFIEQTIKVHNGIIIENSRKLVPEEKYIQMVKKYDHHKIMRRK